jgi:arylsulfotransferase ASST
LRPKITRRRFLQATAGGAALAALGGPLGCDPAPDARATAATSPVGQTWSFRSRPDLRPPVINVTKPPRDTAPGLVLVAPKNGPEESHPSQDGCVILDNQGQPVWLHLLSDESLDVMNFKRQEYKGETVLTWWVGRHTGYGQGECVICDHSYREIKRVRAGNGYEADHHEFLITPEDTALITIYNAVDKDLTSVGGPADATVLDGIVQEIDIESGEVLFEWHSLDHVELVEHTTGYYDHLHLNSIDVFDEDHIIISSRETSTVFKIDRNSGEIVWRLGGEKSDFELGPGVRFYYQHDVRSHPEGTITLFDNGSANTAEQSRGAVIRIDEDAMKATLLREYTHPNKLLSPLQGNVEVLPGGNVFIGWGSSPVISEFSHTGELLFNAEFPLESETYRAFRYPWKGYPKYAPAMAAESGQDDEVKIYASWNGSTEVATWQVLAGDSPKRLKKLASTPKEGFETVIVVKTNEPYVAVNAVDASGKVLSSSRAIKPEKS